MSPRTAALIPVLLALATGCASGKELIPYSTARPTLDYAGRCSIRVIGVDMRDRVARGDATPKQVGDRPGPATSRIPYTTANGEPFARVVANLTSWSLAEKGFETEVVDAPAGASDEDLARLATEGVTHGIVLRVRKWWSLVHRKITIEYDLSLALLGEGGEVLAEVSREGKDDLRQGLKEDAASDVNANELLVVFLGVKLTEMLNDPSVPREMKRFDTTKLSPDGNEPPPLAPAESFDEPAD